MLKIESQYVFIMCPNHSGSTVLYFLINTSNEVSTMNHHGSIIEGQIVPEAMKFMPYAKESDLGLFSIYKKLHQDINNYNWKEIKRIWRNNWNCNKSVLLEKSTTNLYRKNMLENNFYNAKFLIMVRNPYAVCEGIRRKHNVDVSLAIDHWIDTAETQINNISSNSLFFTYEKLCDDTDLIVNQILCFIPSLKNLDYKKKLFRPRYENLVGLQNMNQEQIKRLSYNEIITISNKLKKRNDIVKFYGYEIL